MIYVEYTYIIIKVFKIYFVKYVIMSSRIKKLLQKNEFAKFNVKVNSIALVKADTDTILALKNKTSYFYIAEDEKLHFS